MKRLDSCSKNIRPDIKTLKEEIKMKRIEELKIVIYNFTWNFFEDESLRNIVLNRAKT